MLYTNFSPRAPSPAFHSRLQSSRLTFVFATVIKLLRNKGECVSLGLLTPLTHFFFVVYQLFTKITHFLFYLPK